MQLILVLSPELEQLGLFKAGEFWAATEEKGQSGNVGACLLYTSDAADELDGVDLGGRRIIKKKFFQAEDGIRDQPRSRGLGDVYKRQYLYCLRSWNSLDFLKQVNFGLLQKRKGKVAM